jgi:hypothetical protein
MVNTNYEYTDDILKGVTNYLDWKNKLNILINQKKSIGTRVLIYVKIKLLKKIGILRE